MANPPTLQDLTKTQRQAYSDSWPKPAGSAGAGDGTYADIALGEALGLLTDQGGQLLSPGTPGRTISRAGDRSAAQGRYNQAVANSGQVYDQAVGEVNARAPGIQKAYSDAGEQILANARARAVTDMQNQQTRDSNRAQAASALGLGFVPQNSGRADAVMAANQGQQGINADAWNGFLRAAAGTAGERNSAIADAFRYEQGQQRTTLAKMLEEVMSRLTDYYVGGSGPVYSKAALTPAQRANLSLDLLGNYQGDQKLDISANSAAAKAQDSRAKTNALYGYTPSSKIPNSF